MTVCIAGIHEEGHTGHSSIFLVCDRRVSLFGGWFSQDGNAKYMPVHRDWFGMFAGGVEETTLMLKEINKSLAQLKSIQFEKVVTRCRLTYSKVRRRLVETQVLPEFDILTYREFLQLKRSDEALFLTIKERISAAEEDWSLLFAGFDDARAPHIFVISGPGNVQYCDSQKYAAIGSGAFAAIVWMSFYGYHPQKRVGELLFGAMAAKFFAEKASDVGHNTVVSMINSHMNALFHVVNDQEVEAMRTAWEGLPKFSVDSVKELGKKMQELHEMFNRIKQDHPDINK